MFLDAMSGLAQNANTVGLVKHQPGVVTAAQLMCRRQIEYVTVHRKHCVSDDELSGALRRSSQLLLQVIHVIVTEARKFATRQQAAIHNTGVIPPVGEYPVPSPYHGADCRQVSHVAGAVNDCLLAPGEFSDRPLHLSV